ncbi:ferritin-like domain-containing protein [Flavihumibacter solisilvae]|uniref:Aldehyde dehydrogenase n=1 Tax=Flavihumibacter solisilvae TaxID=1349421 RepID=A0A0C1L2F3_9BACT|nr:PA2169 family four-helix-bundle protein [Flavihumibacter solisilvae]KIC93791.1 aldehyde dehydrogenase [Flavihumibacter solisilvae]
MQRNEELNEVLNDLIQINNDRIEGYERAIKDTETERSDLLQVFNRMIEESRGFKSSLQQMVGKYGGEVETDDTTVKGKVYRMWMDIKSVFSGHSGKSALELCEFGEDAAQRAYEEALESDATMDADVRTLVRTQKDMLKISHDRIKAMRDADQRQKAH